jgi:hypothetical protein
MKIPNATYPSPNLRYDPAAREVIFERLNPVTGDVTFQVPSRETLREEAHAAETGAADPNSAPPPVSLLSSSHLSAPDEPSEADTAHPAPTGTKSGGAKGTSVSILV